MAGGPFRVGSSHGVTIIYDPDYDPIHVHKTGQLWATAQTKDYAAEIVFALNVLWEARGIATKQKDS